MSNIFDKFIGRYVLVRCHDAGIHAGVLDAANERGCVLRESRRLHRWYVADGQDFLSGVAAHGLTDGSMVGVELELLALTEDCEIALVSKKAEKSIRNFKSYTPDDAE